MKPFEEFCPQNRAEWRAWLQAFHQESEAVWLIFYKKKSPNFNLSWSDAVDEALCFGWIDSVKKTVDAERYKQYFSPRKAKSNWSKVNKQKVAELTEQGLMTEAGLKSIAVAKENGSWTILDAIEALEVPHDLKKALAATPNASDYFEELSASQKKLLLHWVMSAKRPETRQKRIAEIAENAGLGQKPKQFR